MALCNIVDPFWQKSACERIHEWVSFGRRRTLAIAKRKVPIYENGFFFFLFERPIECQSRESERNVNAEWCMNKVKKSCNRHVFVATM